MRCITRRGKACDGHRDRGLADIVRHMRGRVPMRRPSSMPAAPRPTAARPRREPGGQRPDRRGHQAAGAHRPSRQEQRHLLRAAVRRRQGQCRDGVGQLAAGAAGGRCTSSTTPRPRSCSSARSTFRSSRRSATSSRRSRKIVALGGRHPTGSPSPPGATASRRPIRICRPSPTTRPSSSTPAARPACPRAPSSPTPTSASMLPLWTRTWLLAPGVTNLVCLPMFHIGGAGWGIAGLFAGADQPRRCASSYPAQILRDHPARAHAR